MTPLQGPGSEAWMPNGFPPPSFVVEIERTTTVLGGTRGRWLAAAAILGVILLIAGVLLIVRQGDDKTALKAGSSTTARSGTGATFSSSSTSLDATATLPNATTTAPGSGGSTGVGGGGVNGGGAVTPPLPGAMGTAGTAGPAPPAGPGVLAATNGAISLPRTAPQSGTVTLKNTGGSSLNFTSQTDRPGALSVSPDTGTIAPGATATVTITVDPAKVAEGPFSGTVGFGGSGGNQQVKVTTTVGRAPTINDNAGQPCPTETSTCSKLIRLVNPPNASATPCNNRWFYAAVITDESSLKSVKAHTQKSGTGGGGADVDLKIGGATSGSQGQWQSDQQDPLPAGTTLKFTLEAIDQFDDSARSSERTIACP